MSNINANLQARRRRMCVCVCSFRVVLKGLRKVKKYSFKYEKITTYSSVHSVFTNSEHKHLLVSCSYSQWKRTGCPRKLYTFTTLNFRSLLNIYANFINKWKAQFNSFLKLWNHVNRLKNDRYMANMAT